MVLAAMFVSTVRIMPTWALVVAAVCLLAVLWGAYAALAAKLARSRMHRRASTYSPTTPSKLAGKTILVLVNPYGGSKSAPSIYRNIVRPMCRAAGIRVEMVLTQHAGHAFDIAKGLEPGKYAVLVCVSGDGMLHEVINGLAASGGGAGAADSDEAVLARLRSTPLCILPGGTSNGVATTTSNRDPYEAVRSLVEGGPRGVDLYSVRSEGMAPVWDAHVFSWAMVAEHNELAERKLRWMGKRLKELYAPVQVILRARRHGGRVIMRPCAVPAADYAAGDVTDPAPLPDVPRPRLAGAPTPAVPGVAQDSPWKLLEDDGFVVFSASNMAHASHDCVFAPTVQPDDGALDLTILRNPSRLGLFRVFDAMGSGTHAPMPEVDLYRVSEFVLEPTRSTGVLDVSGEVYPLRPVLLRCHRKAAVFWTSGFHPGKPAPAS